MQRKCSMADMALKYNDRWGNYNLCDPSDKDWAIQFICADQRITVMFDEEQWVPSGPVMDPYDCIYILDEWDSKTWISTKRDEVRAFIEFVYIHAWEIRMANIIKRRDTLLIKIRRLQDTLKELDYVEHVTMQMYLPKKKVKNG